MKRIIFLAGLVIVLLAAYASRPDDITCIKGGVKAVWGQLTPDEKTFPQYYDQFMDLNSKNVEVNDYLFFKQVTYQVEAKRKTVALGAFRKVFETVDPIAYEPVIPSPK